MWRKLLARTHPDTGGSHELFIWTHALRETVEESLVRPHYEAPRYDSPTDTADRVPFNPAMDFDAITLKALEMAETIVPPYDALLKMRSDVSEMFTLAMLKQQSRGATYKQLAAIAHTVGMDKSQRLEWYSVAASVPLSVRHAGHLLSKLKGAA
jgi:hypothetical protein